MTINNIPIQAYGAKLRADYSVSGPAVTPYYGHPKNGSALLVFGRDIGLKTLVLPFDIFGKSPADVERKLSALYALALSGQVEIGMPDGFFYSAVLESIESLGTITPCARSCSLTFSAIEHESKQRMELPDGVLLADGTMPRMDCVLTATVGADAQRYPFAGVTFMNVTKGDILVLDGMTKRVLINGAPGAQRCDLVEFPTLVPGRNVLSCPDAVTVEYYPAYL